MSLLGAGIGLLLRDTAGAVTAILALLYAAPVVAMFPHRPQVAASPAPVRPLDAGLAIQATRNFQSEHIEAWNGVGVLSLYAAATCTYSMWGFSDGSRAYRRPFINGLIAAGRPRAAHREAEFLAVGPGAAAWLTEAAAVGAHRIRVKIAEAVTLA